MLKSPALDSKPVESLTSGQMSDILMKLEGHRHYPIVAFALGKGMRRDEILGL